MPSNIFLTSSVSTVARSIAEKLDVENKRQKLLFINTAAEIEEEAGDDMQWMRDNRESLLEVGFKVADYTITGKSKEETRAALDGVDVIYVEGGDSFYLLFKLQQTQAGDLIKDQVRKGKIYIGASAGSIVAGPDIRHIKSPFNNEKYIKKLTNTSGMELTDLTILPHWENEIFRDVFQNHWLDQAYGESQKLVLLNDFQYIEVLNDGYKIVDVRENS